MSNKSEYLEKMFKDVKRSQYKLSKQVAEFRDFVDGTLPLPLFSLYGERRLHKICCLAFYWR